MPVLIATKSIFIEASQQTVWDHLSDVRKWPLWHDDVRTVELLESLKVGAQGKLYPNSGLPTVFTVTKFIEPKTIQISATVYRNKLMREYRVSAMLEGSIASFDIHCDGFLDKVVAAIFRRSIGRKLQQSLSQLKYNAEKVKRTSVSSGS